MIDFMNWLAAAGGIGAVFAVLLFFVYRNTNKQMREDRKYAEDRLTSIIENYNEATAKNNQVMSELITYLKARNGSK